MNNLFLWLYIADLMEVANVVCILSAFAAFVSSIAWFIGIGEAVNQTDEKEKNRIKSIVRPFKCASIICLCVSILLAVLPSKKTIYMTLGANVSGEVVNSATGKKALKVLNQKLDKLIEDEE